MILLDNLALANSDQSTVPSTFAYYLSTHCQLIKSKTSKDKRLFNAITDIRTPLNLLWRLVRRRRHYITIMRIQSKDKPIPLPTRSRNDVATYSAIIQSFQRNLVNFADSATVNLITAPQRITFQPMAI